MSGMEKKCGNKERIKNNRRSHRNKEQKLVMIQTISNTASTSSNFSLLLFSLSFENSLLLKNLM